MKFLVVLNISGSNHRFTIPADSERDAIAYAVAAFSIFVIRGKDIPSDVDLTGPGGIDALKAIELSVGAVEQI